MDAEATRALVERVLARSGADEVEITMDGGRETHLRFARNEPTTSGTASNMRITVSSTFGTKTGRATVNQFDDDSLAEVVRRSEELAQLSPDDPEHMPVLGPQDLATVDAVRAESEAEVAEGMATLVEAAIARAAKADLVAAGFVAHDDRFHAIGTSAGLFAWTRATSASASMTARTADGRGSGWASTTGRAVAELDAGALAAAADTALASHEPTLLEPGDYPTVLTSSCVASLAELLSRSLDRRAADEGRSFFASAAGPRVGERLFSEAFTLVSDPAAVLTPATPWGDGGLPRRPTTWIEQGTLRALATSRYWAGKTGAEPLPYPPNVIVAGGEGSVADLVAGLERGVLVTSLWYIRSVDPRQLLYTGLTRDGVFWVENGKIVRPVNNFRWNDSVADVFTRIEALSAPERPLTRGSSTPGAVVPGMRVSSFRFSSVSDAI